MGFLGGAIDWTKGLVRLVQKKYFLKPTYTLSPNEKILFKELNEALDVLETNGLVTPKRISEFCCNVFVENSLQIQSQFHDIKLDEYKKDVAVVRTVISEYNTYITENSSTKIANYRSIKIDLKNVMFRIILRFEECVNKIQEIDGTENAERMFNIAHHLSNAVAFNNELARKYFDLLIVCIGYLYKINDELEENIITKDILDELNKLFKDILNSNNRTLLKEYDPTYSDYWYEIPTNLNKILDHSYANMSSDKNKEEEVDWDNLDEII